MTAAARGLFCFHNGDFQSAGLLLCVCVCARTREVCYVCCIEDGRECHCRECTEPASARLHCFCQLRDERGEFSGHVSKGHRAPPIHFSPACLYCSGRRTCARNLLAGNSQMCKSKPFLFPNLWASRFDMGAATY